MIKAQITYYTPFQSTASASSTVVIAFARDNAGVTPDTLEKRLDPLEEDITELMSRSTGLQTDISDLREADATTLCAAEGYTDTQVAIAHAKREEGDRTTLAAARTYADQAVSELVAGSPAALDTLRELADALGNDANFAATVAGQIGLKVDKVPGKGLSSEDYSQADKKKLDGIAAGANAYTHPATHVASMIVQDASHRFISDAERTAWNALQDQPHFVLTTDEASALAARDGKVYIVTR